LIDLEAIEAKLRLFERVDLANVTPLLRPSVEPPPGPTRTGALLLDSLRRLLDLTALKRHAYLYLRSKRLSS